MHRISHRGSIAFVFHDKKSRNGSNFIGIKYLEMYIFHFFPPGVSEEEKVKLPQRNKNKINGKMTFSSTHFQVMNMHFESMLTEVVTNEKSEERATCILKFQKMI